MQRRKVLESFFASAVALKARPLPLSFLHSQPPNLSLVDAVGDHELNSLAVVADGEFFYRAAGAWAGDFIPYFRNGRFHLFYLYDWLCRSLRRSLA